MLHVHTAELGILARNMDTAMRCLPVGTSMTESTTKISNMVKDTCSIRMEVHMLVNGVKALIKVAALSNLKTGNYMKEASKMESALVMVKKHSRTEISIWVTSSRT